MTRDEFVQNLMAIDENAEHPTLSEYADIEFVYNYHPSISETDGKRQIATIYAIGGRRIILDMLRTAKIACAMLDDILRLKEEHRVAKEAYEDLKRGVNK